MCVSNPTCDVPAHQLTRFAEGRFLTGSKIDEQLLIDSVSGPELGAVVSFSGCVRAHEGSQTIESISYEAYASMAEREIDRIVARAQERWGVRAAVRHRLGDVAVGEIAVFVACGSPHRPEAFEACRYIIDELKSKAPIWKVRWNPANRQINEGIQMNKNNGESHFSMIDIAGKDPSERTALARGSLQMGREAFDLLRRGALPKGDALKIAEVAGIQAAKRTSELLPLCHPIAVSHAKISFTLDENLPGVHAACTAKASAKTGVEMEALTGATAALLCVYDLVKQVDPALVLSDIRLEEKIGGKSGHWIHPAQRQSPHHGHHSPAQGHDERPAKLLGKASVITVSDRRSRGESKDESGAILADGLSALGFSVTRRLVPDEADLIAKQVRKDAASADVIVLTGGTGLSPRDVTPEAVESVCDRIIPGIGEALRRAGASSTPFSAISRSIAGQLGNTIVIALPGSAGAVRDGLAVLAELLPHAISIARGEDHRSRATTPPEDSASPSKLRSGRSRSSRRE